MVRPPAHHLPTAGAYPCPVQCTYYDAERCRSCTWLPRPYHEQLAAKEQHVRALLGDPAGLTWAPAVASREQGFRNKAKLAVGGTVDAPTLGILDPAGAGVDLQACPLYPAALSGAFGTLAAFVTRAAVVPYDVPTRRGELKHLLVTASADGDLMVRFVLRSQEALARIRKHMPWLHEHLPRLRVATVNLLPEHKAVLEGEREIVLTETATLPMPVGDVTLHLRPQSFFQTNTEVATELYRQAARWADDVAPSSAWDLYCGVGGFALHVARPGRRVVGVELSAEAVVSAEAARDDLGLVDVTFRADDATSFALGTDPAGAPDLVVVNPPRRGIGGELARWLERSRTRHVLYSSCNAVSLARDLAAMPSLRPVRGRVLDMFPHTAHHEVLVLLERA